MFLVVLCGGRVQTAGAGSIASVEDEGGMMRDGMRPRVYSLSANIRQVSV
jgi:hypothetical protein